MRRILAYLDGYILLFLGYRCMQVRERMLCTRCRVVLTKTSCCGPCKKRWWKRVKRVWLERRNLPTKMMAVVKCSWAKCLVAFILWLIGISSAQAQRTISVVPDRRKEDVAKATTDPEHHLLRDVWYTLDDTCPLFHLDVNCSWKFMPSLTRWSVCRTVCTTMATQYGFGLLLLSSWCLVLNGSALST